MLTDKEAQLLTALAYNGGVRWRKQVIIEAIIIDDAIKQGIVEEPVVGMIRMTKLGIERFEDYINPKGKIKLW